MPDTVRRGFMSKPKCAECGEEMEFVPKHTGADRDVGLPEWNGGYECSECGFTEEFDDAGEDDAE